MRIPRSFCTTYILLRTRAHKEVLFFASPFFEAALSGNWLETGRPQSMSSVITISQPPSIPGDRSINEVATEMTFAPIDPDIEPDDASVDLTLDLITKSEGESAPTSESETESSDADGINEMKVRARDSSLAKLQSGSDGLGKVTDKGKLKDFVGDDGKLSRRKVCPAKAKVRRRRKSNGPDAVIVLKEERVCKFVTSLFSTERISHLGKHIP